MTSLGVRTNFVPQLASLSSVARLGVPNPGRRIRRVIMMSSGYRQGDIFIEPIAALPAACAERAPQQRHGEMVHVLAEGEVSGHAHCIAAGGDISMLRDTDDRDPMAVGYL